MVFSRVLILLVALCAGGCRTYYGQAVRGQWQLLTQPQPIAELLRGTNAPPELRRRLELVQRLRAFAVSELSLRTNGHYSSYLDLGRDHVVWNVFAAPEFSLQDKTWWFPVVGRVSYRGYFREDLARNYARALAGRGFDVHVGGVDAFSTLGWFNDPVLNTFWSRNDTDLAELLFHELAHQRVYLSGDTEFNEAFATAVATEGVRRWLRANGDTTAIAAYEDASRREEQFIALLQSARGELERLYAQTNGLPVGELRTRKAAAFGRLRDGYTALRREWGGYAGYDRWFAQPLNNALLNTVDTYHHLVPGFTALLEQCGSDFGKFYRAARQLRQLKKPDRHAHLKQLAARPRAESPPPAQVPGLDNNSVPVPLRRGTGALSLR